VCLVITCGHLLYPSPSPIIYLSILSRLTPFDTMPKKYTNSGLQDNVKVKKATRTEDSVDPLESGGLNEEDANATHPSFKLAACKAHGESHECEVKHCNNACNIPSIFNSISFIE